MFFSLFFLHANCIIHKIISIFSRFENPYANSVMRMMADNSQVNLYEDDLVNTENSDEHDLPDEQLSSSGSGISDEPFIADPLVKPHNTETHDTHEQPNTDDVFQGQLQEEYERGYADAVNALEKSITDERNQIQNLNSVLFEIHVEFE